MRKNKYLALLRGINVGGKSLIKMADLKTAVEHCGFGRVSTYIQSGNVIFEAEGDAGAIEEILEKSFLKSFGYQIMVVVVSKDQLVKILDEVPDVWKRGEDLRCYLAFVKKSTTPNEVLAEIKLKDGVDSAKIGKGVLYMTTTLEGITKSGFGKLVGKDVYKKITIRNFNTVRKIYERMS